jgi:hypothetical protein
MWKLGLRPRYSFSGNIFFLQIFGIFSLQCSMQQALAGATHHRCPTQACLLHLLLSTPPPAVADSKTAFPGMPARFLACSEKALSSCYPRFHRGTPAWQLDYIFFAANRDQEAGGRSVGAPHRVHRVVTSAFWRAFSHEGKISLAWCGWGVHAHPLSFYLPSPVKLQCTLQLSGQIH